MNTLLDLLTRRQSTPSKLLSEPGPDPAQLDALLRMAMRVPDHGNMTPFRILGIRGDHRLRLSARLAEVSAARGDDPAKVEKDRNRFNHAPLILAVIAHVTPGHKVPEQEQLLSAGLVAYNLLLGAESLGFGAQWLTGWSAYDRGIAEWLRLAAHERVVAWVHIGTRSGSAPDRPRPEPSSKYSEWQST
ncbi:MAG: nitroreductase [Ahniella sp.]|nr:nitroreductase [Ahniella sp.]